MRRYVFLAMASGLLGAGEAEAAQKNPVVVMETNMGTVKIEVFADKAPISAKNFLDYVDAKYYDGLIFHRVISNFMIQGGGFEPGMKEKKKTNDPIKNEASNGLLNARGTLAMARTSDPHSATSQFFINVKDNKFLDKSETSDGYAVFGKVIEGLEGVVDKIKEVKTGKKGPHGDVPLEDVVIKSIRRAQ